MKQKNKKTLLVMLDSNNASMLAESFVSLSNDGGYAIRVIRSGKDAIGIIRICPPDVILLDDALLEKEGEKTLSAILSLGNYPVILMTPYMSSDVVPRFMEMGGYGCIRKNSEIHSMNSIVARATSRT